eukprot:jgi/Psemu1/34461/gm1.34461_g
MTCMVSFEATKPSTVDFCHRLSLHDKDVDNLWQIILERREIIARSSSIALSDHRKAQRAYDEESISKPSAAPDYRRPNAPTTRYITKATQRAYAKESISKPSAAPPSFKEGPTRLRREYLERLYCARHFHSNNMNYREYFQGSGPFGEAPARHNVYQAIYTLFTEADGERLLPLLLDIFNAQAIGGLGIFQEDAAGVDRLRVIHGLRRYPGTITQPSANRGRAFGYIDDVEGQEGELVQVDAALLSRAAASRVYLMAHHEATISQHPERDYIPAIPEGTAHTEMLQAHKQAFQVLQPHIHQQGLENICKPLLDTLRAVGTQPTTLLGAIRLLEPGPSFRAEANLRAYMKSHVLLRDLPGLRVGPAAPADPNLTAAFSALTDQQLRLSESLDQRRQEASKLHSVRAVWGDLYTERLLLLCGKPTEAELPPIYTAWAKKSKHEKTHMILQSQVATDAYNLGIQAPLITTAVLKRFQDCNFYGTDSFDVADGILPLAFTPPGGSAATLKREHEAAANVAAYDTMISTQGNSLSLKDSLELQKTKAYIPLDWTEATTQLKSYLAVLATLLGATHDVVKGYQRGLSRLEWQQMRPSKGHCR